MLSKANTSLPVPLVQDSVYKYVPLRSIENHTAASYVVNHATSELEIHSNLLQKSKRVNTFPPRILSGLLEKVITLNNLWKEWKNRSGGHKWAKEAQRGRLVVEVVVVVKWPSVKDAMSEILSPSHLCLIPTWMRSQIGDVGVCSGRSLSIADRKKTRGKRDRVCACWLYVWMHVWVNRFMASSALC